MILKKQSWLLYFLFPVLAISMNWCHWEWGAFGKEPRVIFLSSVKILCLVLFVHWVLLRPLTVFVWERAETISPSIVGFSAVSLSVPLVAMAYWIGDVRTVLQAQEVALSVIPPVILSLLVYLQKRSLLCWSISLSSMMGIHFFWISEILGPFKTSFYLLIENPHFEWFRIIYPGFVIALYYRLNWEPQASSLKKILSRINSIHHSRKSSGLS